MNPGVHYGAPWIVVPDGPDGRVEHFYAEGNMDPVAVVPQDVLRVPLRETILAVLHLMPKEAAPEHLAAMIESQVQAWQARHV